MNWFFIRLGIDLLISGLLLALLLITLRRFRPKRVRSGGRLFIPVLVALLLLIQVLTQTAPKLLDSLRVFAHSESLRNIEVAEVSRSTGRMLSRSGEVFYVSILNPLPERGERYALRFLPLSRFVISFERDRRAPDAAEVLPEAPATELPEPSPSTPLSTSSTS